MNKETVKRAITFEGQEAADVARIIERNMKNKVFIHKLLIRAQMLEKLYPVER